jgi:hypothetical protein
MSYGDIGQIHVWKEFFKDVSSDAYSVILHRKDGVPQSDLPSVTVIPTIPSEYGKWSLVQVSQALFRKGLENEENQTFILLSGDTIPIRSFRELSEKVSGKEGFFQWYGGSEERMEKINKEILRTLSDRFCCVKHSQWVVLDRKYIQLFESHFELMEQAFSEMVIPDEHAYGIMLEILGVRRNIQYDFLTYIDWNITEGCPHGIRHHYHPKTFHLSDLTPERISAVRHSGSYFMRKICGAEPIPADIFRW